MSSSGITSSLDLDNVNTKGRPVDPSQEPGNAVATSSVVGASTGEPSGKKTQDRIIDTTGIQPLASGSASGNNGGSAGDSDPLWQKLAVIGAIAAAGIAIVAGAKHVKENRKPESTWEKAQRKTKEAAHNVKHGGDKAAHEVKHSGDGHGHGIGHKVSDTVGAVQDKVVGAGEDAEIKATEAQQEVKERIEAQTKKADKAAAKPDALAEQKRMTYGQHDNGTPKKALEDTGDGFLNYKQWWPFAKKDL